MAIPWMSCWFFAWFLAGMLAFGVAPPPVAAGEIEELVSAANGGDGTAQFKVGTKYFMNTTDEGLPKGFLEAMKWYFGNNEGMMRSLKVPMPQTAPPVADTAKWFQSCAPKNHFCKFVLGDLYKQGVGVPKDLVQALMWHTLYGETSQIKATSALMTSEQIAQAQQLAKNWNPAGDGKVEPTPIKPSPVTSQSPTSDKDKSGPKTAPPAPDAITASDLSSNDESEPQPKPPAKGAGSKSDQPIKKKAATAQPKKAPDQAKTAGAKADPTDKKKATQKAAVKKTPATETKKNPSDKKKAAQKAVAKKAPATGTKGDPADKKKAAQKAAAKKAPATGTKGDPSRRDHSDQNHDPPDTNAETTGEQVE